MQIETSKIRHRKPRYKATLASYMSTFFALLEFALLSDRKYLLLLEDDLQFGRKNIMGYSHEGK